MESELESTIFLPTGIGAGGGVKTLAWCLSRNRSQVESVHNESLYDFFIDFYLESTPFLGGVEIRVNFYFANWSRSRSQSEYIGLVSESK